MEEVKEQYLIAIRVDNVTLGHVDVNEVTAGAVLDLEDCTSVHGMLAWLHTYAGADREATEQALRPLKAKAILTMARQISSAIGAAVGNENA